MKTSLDELPPFPEDVPTAPIAAISLPKLLANDDAECQRVLQACQGHGFFYLDMRDCSEGEALLDEAEQLHEVAKGAFDHPFEEKNKYALQKGVSLWGYKEAGTVKKTDPNKRPDTTEFFNISKDHMHGVTPARDYPAEIEDAKPILKDFTKNAHTTGMLVLGILARQLGLEAKDFQDRNIFTHPSGDHCRLTKKTPHKADAKDVIGLPSHTDFGSITILFNWLGGLQIQSHDPRKLGEWEFVKPLPGHAIINLGDAMVKFTNGALKSAKHRVVPAPGEQVGVDRYSIVYFVRPANDVMMEPVGRFKDGAEGFVKVAGKFEASDKVLPAGEWMLRRSIQMGQ